jgi:hypothetical protein
METTSTPAIRLANNHYAIQCVDSSLGGRVVTVIYDKNLSGRQSLRPKSLNALCEALGPIVCDDNGHYSY